MPHVDVCVDVCGNLCMCQGVRVLHPLDPVALSFVPDGLTVMERWPWATGGSQQDSRDPQGQRSRVRGSWSPRALHCPHVGTRLVGPGCPSPIPNWIEQGRTTQASILLKPFNNHLVWEGLGSLAAERERQR